MHTHIIAKQAHLIPLSFEYIVKSFFFLIFSFSFYRNNIRVLAAAGENGKLCHHKRS